MLDFIELISVSDFSYRLCDPQSAIVSTLHGIPRPR